MVARAATAEKWLGELHDYLWIPGWKGDPEALRKGLLSALGGLDRAVRARGLLKSTAEKELRRLDRSERTEALYMYLSLLHRLSAAARAARAGGTEEVARSAEEIVDSALIHLAALCGRFDLVEQYRKGALDFLAYSGAVADAAEPKGLRDAGSVKRLLNTVHEAARISGRLRNPAERLAAGAFLVQGSSWIVVQLPDWLRTISAPPPAFYRTLGPLATRAAQSQ